MVFVFLDAAYGLVVFVDPLLRYLSSHSHSLLYASTHTHIHRYRAYATQVSSQGLVESDVTLADTVALKAALKETEESNAALIRRIKTLEIEVSRTGWVCVCLCACRAVCAFWCHAVVVCVCVHMCVFPCKDLCVVVCVCVWSRSQGGLPEGARGLSSPVADGGDMLALRGRVTALEQQLREATRALVRSLPACVCACLRA